MWPRWNPGVGYAAPGTWPHKARDWRGRRVVVPHTTPDGLLVNFYGWAVGTAAQIPKATTTVMRVLSCAFASAM